MKIFKYELQLEDEQLVPMPKGSLLLSVQDQRGKLCLWVLVNENNPQVNRMVFVIGTGNPIKGNPGQYVASAQQGPYVWHVFDGGEKK